MSDVEDLLNKGLLAESQGVSSETRELLASENFSEILHFDQETLIIIQGGEPGGLYFTLSGLFHAVSHTNLDAPQRLLGRIEPGEFIGEVSLFDRDSKATASVKAMKDASALSMTRASFRAFCKSHPVQALEFVTAVAHGLAARLRSANEKVL
jgi:CRP-like cAMP-binding protein